MKTSTRKLSSQDSFHSAYSTECEFSPNKQFESPSLRRSATIAPNVLSNARIIQSKLVYIINLPESAADAETLASQAYFGQYGTITKCVVNRSSQHTAYQAYITFANDEEAAVSIKACNKFVLDGNELTLTFGTTKYCNYFLRGNACPKPECLYLHEFAQKNNVMPREVMPHTKHIQPCNSIYDGIKVHISQPGGGNRKKLPEARVIRERAFSQQIYESPGGREENKSRFGFLVDGEETEVPTMVNTLRKFSSPKGEVAEIPLLQYESIKNQLGANAWFNDILEFKLQPETVLVISRT